MNKTEIANKFLMFQCMNEIMLSNYDQCTLIKPYFNSSLHNKLKNLRAEFERESVKMHQLITDESEYLKFHQVVQVIEKIMQSAGDLEMFNKSISILDHLYSGDLEVKEQ